MTASEMVERVARALHKRMSPAKIYDNLPERSKALLRDDARAAIEAMKEPSPAMRRAGIATSIRQGRGVDVTEIFSAMISAALSEDTGMGKMPIYGAKNVD